MRPWLAKRSGLCFALIALAQAEHAKYVQAVQVLSGYEQNFVVNGKPSTRDTVFLSATESDSTGSLQVGDFRVNITAIAPSYNFRFTEVGRVPKRSQLATNRVCVVNDVESYLQSQQLASRQQGIVAPGGSQTLSTQTSVTPTSRRLLQTDGQDPASESSGFVQDDFSDTQIGVLGLFVPGATAAFALALAQDNRQRINSLGTAVGSLLQGSSNLLRASNATNQRIDLTEQDIKLLFNNTQELKDTDKALAFSISKATASIQQLQNTTGQQFKDLEDVIKNNNAISNAFFAASDNRTAESFRQVYNAMTTLNSNLQTEVNFLLTSLLEANRDVDSLNQALTRQVSGTDLDRLTTKAFYETAAKLDPTLQPFTLGLGIPPASQLFGANQRLLLDRYDLGTVTPTVGAGAAANYIISSSQVRVYVDSKNAIETLKFASNTQQLAQRFSESNCLRAYSDPDVPADVASAETSGTCAMWMEVRTFSCTANRLTPKFSWSNATEANIPSSACANNAQAVAAPVRVIRTLGEASAFFAGAPCALYDGPIVITSLRLRQIYALASENVICKLSWKAQISRAIAAQSTNDLSIMYFLLTLAQSSIIKARLDLLSLELQLYGRNPGGIKYEKRPADYVPVSYSAAGVPVYDGSQKPLDCTYSSFLAVDRQTVPMYSVQPIAAAVVNKAVRVSIGDGPECLDPTGVTCYPVGESDVTSNIALSDDAQHILPGSFLMVGNLLNFDEGIYDIPQRTLTASPSTSERAYTPSYILMPPGQTATDDLPTWISRNSDLFDPEKGAVSAGLYRFAARYDAQGYPYCTLPNLADALAPAPNTTSHGCLLPFNYTTSALVIAGNTQVFPTQCSSVSSVLIYASRSRELAQPSMSLANGSPLALALAGQSSVSLSFWYKASPIVGDNGAVSVLQVGSDLASGQLQFIVNALGQPGVLMPGFDSLLTLAKSVYMKSDTWRQVLWSVTYVGGSFRFALWLDGVAYGFQSYSTPAFFGSSPRLIALTAQLPASVNAEVRDVESHSVLSDAVAHSLYTCELARLDGRCSPTANQPPGAERFIVALDSTSRSTDCSLLSGSAQLLSVNNAYDVLQPRVLSAASAFTQSWSLSFWLRGGELAPTQTLLRASANNGQALATYSSVTKLVTFSVNGANFTAALLDGKSHHVVLQYNAATSSARAYIDLSLAFSASTGPASSQPATLVSTLATMVKMYNAKVLSLAEVSQDALCQLPTGQTSSLFVPPVGLCSKIDGSAYGYCRTPGSCNGHCSQYSVIDEPSNQFVALSNECDDGWAAPACTARCSRVDPISNKCLDFLTQSATGATPASQLCDTLSNYQLSVNAGAGTLRLTPRRWQYTVNLNVPSGKVTNIINSGGCPQVAVVATISGDISLTLANPGTQNNVINVLFAPPGVFNNSQACELPCCSIDGSSPITVIANSQTSFSIPSQGCGPLAVVVQQVVNIAGSQPGAAPIQCSSFTAEEVQNLVATSFNQVVPVSVASSIIVTKNQLLLSLSDITKSLAQQVLNLFALRDSATYNSDTFNELVAASLFRLNNNTFNAVELQGYQSTFNVDSSAADLLAAQNALAARLAEQDRVFAANRRQYDLNTNASKALSVEVNDALEAAKKNFDDAAKALADASRDPSSGDALGNLFRSIAQGVVDGTEGLAGAARDLLNLPKNLLGNLFGGLIEFVMLGGIVIGAGLGVYLLFKLVSGRSSGGGAPQIVYSQLPAAQPPQYRGESATGQMLRRQVQRQNKYMQRDSDEMDP